MSKEKLRSALERMLSLYDEKKKYEGKRGMLDYSEAEVRDDFVASLFSALGWDVGNPDEFDREHHIRKEGFADISLKIDHDSEKIPAVFVEVKRFGGVPNISCRKIRTTTQDRPIFSDWTDEERQVLNYASKTVNVKWAILTNFEKFRLFNARTGDTVINIEDPQEYLQEGNFEDLLHLTKDSVINGTIERLQSRIVRDEIDINFLTMLNSWRLDLANDLFSKCKDTLNIEEISKIVQRILDRLIIVRYSEDHWIFENPDLLKALYESWLQMRPYKLLTEGLQSFFSRFNDFYDSKIFGRDEQLDEALRNLDDNLLGKIISHLYGVSFRKFTSDILGNTYESYLGSKLVMNKGNLQLKTDYALQKGQGIYYTPVPVVEYITEKTVGEFLKNMDFREVSQFRVLDPACGSGSFLIKAFDFLERHYKEKNEELRKERERKLREIARTYGNQFTLDTDVGKDPLSNLEKRIVKENLFGVDLDEKASEIASVNLILKAIKPKEKLPLILYENIKVGNSLLSWLDIDADMNEYSAPLSTIKEMRQKLKETETREGRERLEKEEFKIKDEVNLVYNKILMDSYFEKLERKDELIPFNWQIEFPEVFDLDMPREKRGFNVVLGNPPWVSYGLRDVEKLPEEWKRYYCDKLSTSAEYKISTYALFMGRGISLLNSKGLLGFIVPDSFLLGRYFSKIREYILNTTKIKEIVLILEDFWPHGTVGRCVIIVLEREDDENVRRETMMTIRCCETLRDLGNRKFRTYQYEQAYFEASSHRRFRLFFDRESKEFVDKVESGSCHLNQFVTPYSGCIGRYGQKSIISDDKRDEFVIRNSAGEIIYEDREAFSKWRPLLESGSDIDRYALIYKGKYVYFEPDEEKRKIYAKSGFDEKKYTDKKLFLRQTGDSLVATYDEGTYFCLNNMHVVNLLEDVKDYDIKYILAMLNSKLMNYFYHLISLEWGRTLAQTDIETIEELPIKKIDFKNEKERRTYDEIVNKTNLILLLNKQRIYILKLFKELIKKHRQDSIGSRPLSAYYTKKAKNHEYEIDYLRSEELIDYREEGVVISVKMREEEDFLVISVLLENESKYKDIIKIRFTDELFKHFFSLALETFIIENAEKRKGSKVTIFEILDNLRIPSHATLRTKDAQNIRELMKTLKDLYEKAVGKEFSESPVKEFDLTKIHRKISEVDQEIDEQIYELYDLHQNEIVLIEKNSTR